MKFKSLLSCCVAISASLTCAAQSETVEPLAPIVPVSYYNPLHPLMLCADPTAIEYEGRIYVYGTNDQQEYDAVSPGTNNSYGHIKTLVVMSSADMVNWTYHGTIDMGKVCGSWMATSWAPSIVSRKEADGLTHFYMYFSNSGGGVGVVTSTSPVGPWTSPLNRSLISGSTPGLGQCRCPFDPGVVIDDEGNGWLAFGGGDPVDGGTKLMPGNARIVKLGDDMISLASDIVPIPAPYHFEANELNIIGGKFVYSYCTGWSDRNDWRSYGASGSAPSTCSICYMISDDPLNPNSWQWGGECLANPGSFGYPWGNNHCHLHKFCDNYYMFYHTQVMENLAGIKGGYRSIAVNKATVDESAIKISPISATNSGASQIKENKLNALERQQAETFWNAVGVNFSYEKRDGNMSVTGIQPGSWVAVRNAQFPGDGANKFTAKIRGKGTMEVRIGNVNSDAVATVNFSSSTMNEITVDLNKTITGTSRNIYFVFMQANTSTRFDEWQFSYDESQGISDVEVESAVTSVEYLTIVGAPVANPQAGIYIRRTVYADGTTKCQKVLLP